MPLGIRQYRASFGSQSEGDEATALLPNKDFFCNGGCSLREKCAQMESDGADGAKTWLERKVWLNVGIVFGPV